MVVHGSDLGVMLKVTFSAVRSAEARLTGLRAAGLSFVACFLTGVGAASENDGSPPWAMGRQLVDLKTASCPVGPVKRPPENLPLRFSALNVSEISGPALLSGLVIAGAWELSSDTRAFGGLSGLVETPDGGLLAVGDNGIFVRLDLDPLTHFPSGEAQIAPLRGENGAPLTAQRDRDAEGLAFRDGWALVSFEHNHRILAYDLAGCGLAARGVELAHLATRQPGVRLRPNLGAEALGLASDDTLWVGLEAPGKQGAIMGRVGPEGILEAEQQTRPPSMHLMTGLDQKRGLVAKLFRAYDPVRGNRIAFSVSDRSGLRAEGRLDTSGPVDNFEGIAIGQNPQGGTRIWLISDDNFNPSQRTLLFALDLVN